MATVKQFNWDFMSDGKKMNMKVWGTHDPDISNSTVTKAVIVQHGSSRNADGYAKYANNSAIKHGEDDGDYAVFSLDFPVSGEQTSTSPYWTSSSWKQGGNSVNASYGDPVSSFEVMDKLVYEVAQKFTGLEQVVLTGHSAGGQFMDRYAAGGDISPLENAGVDVGFVPTNPSSWMFFDDTINYGYGTARLNPYMAEVGKAQLADNFAGRQVTVFLGGEDDYNEGQLDTSRQARAQGDNRLERGQNFYDHIQDVFGVQANHDEVIAPGVGHSGSGMFTSLAGQDLLWG